MNRVNVKCAVLPRKTRATSLWRHKITSKYYEVGQENWHFTFIEMRPLPAYFRETFKICLSWAFRIKFFIWRYCKYKEWASYFSAFMGNELGWGSDKSSENRFAVHGICHVPHQSSFSHERRKKDTHSLNISKYKSCFPEHECDIFCKKNLIYQGFSYFLSLSICSKVVCYFLMKADML